MKKVLGNRGMGIVEVLVALGLTGGLGLIVAQLMEQSHKSTKSAESSSDVLTVTQSIQRLLANPENCKETFQTKIASNNPNAAVALKDKASGTFQDNFKTIGLDPEVRYGQRKVRIKSYSLSDEMNDVSVADFNTSHVVIEFDKSEAGGRTVFKRIPIKVEVDSAGKIISCTSVSNSKSDIWTYADNNLDIFFNSDSTVSDEKIGIGTIDPQELLDVNGVAHFNGVLSGNVVAARTLLEAYQALPGTIASSFPDGSAVGIGQNSNNETGLGISSGVLPNLSLFFDPDYMTMGGTSVLKSYNRGLLLLSDSNPKSASVYLDGPSGNVGVGTFEPKELLDVNGVAHFNGILSGNAVVGRSLLEAYATLPGTIVSAFDNGSAVGIGHNTNNETGLGISASGVAKSALYFAPGYMGGSTVVKSYEMGLLLISDSGPSNSASVFLDGATSNVGIGIHAPTAKLHVSGNSQIDGNLTLTGTGNITTSGNINSVVNITATGNITASGTITGSLVTATSDKRLKKDIRPIGQKADEILNLHGISFNWIDSKLGKGRQFGFIAQDVEKVFPELVYTNKNGIKSVAYQSLIPVLVETIRSQQTQIEKLLEHQAALESAICESNPKSKICSKRIADEY